MEEVLNTPQCSRYDPSHVEINTPNDQHPPLRNTLILEISIPLRLAPKCSLKAERTTIHIETHALELQTHNALNYMRWARNWAKTYHNAIPLTTKLLTLLFANHFLGMVSGQLPPILYTIDARPVNGPFRKIRFAPFEDARPRR